MQNTESKTKKLNLTNLVTFSNIKLGGNIPQLNMPYMTSCRDDAPCKKECYCTHGNMAFPNVRNSHMEKYNLYKEDPIAFFNKVDAELAMIEPKYFRYHSAGDIVDEKYLEQMCWLARRHKRTMFLCFTKKYELVNEYLNHHKKPSNLTIVLSNWGSWRVENPHNLPQSFVDFGTGTVEEALNLPLFSYECPGRCEECNGQHCWHMQKGQNVVFHKH